MQLKGCKLNRIPYIDFALIGAPQDGFEKNGTDMRRSEQHM